MTGIEDWNILVNEEFLVSVVHHTTLITSLPFVHTARRCYRLNALVSCKDRPSGGQTLVGWELPQTCAFRGSKSRNKVSVGEPADGSFEERRPSVVSSPFLRDGEVTLRHPIANGQSPFPGPR